MTTWSGALIGHLAEGHAGGVLTAALVPWVFLALDHLLNRPSAVASICLATPALALYGLSRVGARKWQWAAACGVVAALAVAFGESGSISNNTTLLVGPWRAERQTPWPDVRSRQNPRLQRDVPYTKVFMAGAGLHAGGGTTSRGRFLTCAAASGKLEQTV